MADNIIVALIVAVVGSGSLAVVVGKILGRHMKQGYEMQDKVLDKTFGLLGNHMADVKTAISTLTQTIETHDQHEGDRHERWLETENNRVTTCNETAKMLINLGQSK